MKILVCLCKCCNVILFLSFFLPTKNVFSNMRTVSRLWRNKMNVRWLLQQYNNFLLLWIWFVGFHCCYCCCCCCKAHSTFHIKISFFLFCNFIPSLFGKQFIRIFLRGGLSKNITSIFCRHSIKKSKPWMKNVPNQNLEFIGTYEIRLFCLLGNWLKKLYYSHQLRQSNEN